MEALEYGKANKKMFVMIEREDGANKTICEMTEQSYEAIQWFIKEFTDEEFYISEFNYVNKLPF